MPRQNNTPGLLPQVVRVDATSPWWPIALDMLRVSQHKQVTTIYFEDWLLWRAKVQLEEFTHQQIVDQWNAVQN